MDDAPKPDSEHDFEEFWVDLRLEVSISVKWVDDFAELYILLHLRPAVKPDPRILVLNSGSSSVKFALFEVVPTLRRVLSGTPDGIGLPEQVAVEHLSAVGHRIVHGGPLYVEPARITPEMLSELHRMSDFDPEHLPAEIRLIEAVRARAPDLPQVACFDTAFHARLPRVARTLAIPRRYEASGVRRYGFHGLSYAFLMAELQRIAGEGAAQGRVILAHLGSGASLAAVRGGVPIDTSMGFTPASGVPMSRRSGDLDPGLAAYLARAEGMDAERFNRMVNTEAGLLGVSETSGDMVTLLAREAEDHRAAEAVALFCYQVKKCVGAYAAALGGLDTLIFSGGIGENAPVVRARICEGLGFLGVQLDSGRNAAGQGVISASAVTVRVLHTDEELMIARSVCSVLQIGSMDGSRP